MQPHLETRTSMTTRFDLRRDPTSSDRRTAHTGRRTRASSWSTLTCALALLCALLWSPTTDARLHAYYVVQNVSLGGITPRILFVLDTSGSMVLRAQATPDWCNWTGCEDGSNADISRIAAARRAINLVVEDYKDQARFALMTFSRESSPSKAAEVPDDCNGGSGSCLLYTSPSPRDYAASRMPSSA